ncbi:hypothetical protein Hbl1158_14245 [Halobaculum sp. CBA1158]|uniref:hypothetical protein n=1 Tax=Halobaculum sp. CBA1158 TaxID=2904243 RepID=UPI001F3FB25C|nr:hypothetical protein [Halobaculum sp. CBA1158]UIO99667.1 hypothetical protein Hbl1158_14245 [Halobaculum sp. CBA1158]
MRSVTRKTLVGLGVVVLLLLALGALPSYLGSGDPYYLEATPADDAEGPAYELNATEDGIAEQRFQYFFAAVEADDGRSEGYQRGAYGLKEEFAHSPFDEVATFREFAPAGAVEGDAVFVRYNDTRYRVTVTQP